MTRFDYLIVGGGMTADAAAHGIRQQDTKGSIAIIGAEPDRPYNRPPLTKALWKGDDLDTIWRKTDETGAELMLGRRVTALDPAKRQVTDDKGASYEYGKLLLATGGTPRRLPNAPDAVIHYRTVADYRKARKLADGKASFVVIGGGFIGSEIAAGIRMQEREVTLIVKEAGLGARVFPADLSRHLVDYYREKGVTVRTGETVAGVEARGSKLTVRVEKADTIEADAVIAGLGIEPNVELARAAGLKVSDGIEVDEQLRSSKAGDLCGRRRRQLPQPRPRHPDAGGARGQREHDGRGRRAQHGRRRPPLRPSPVLLFRPVRAGLRGGGRRQTPGTRRSPTGRRSSGKAWSITSRAGGCGACCCGMSGTRSMRPGR